MSLSLARLKSLLGLSSAGGTWRLLAIIFALLNVKNWPFVWHIRILTPLLRHILLSPPSFSPPTATSAPLFAPLITTTRSPLLECDYNLHKSNSTYFSDLDVARSHLVTALCAKGMGIVHRAMEREEGGGGILKVMLGGVYCGFRREIKPYQGYEIWTRVLAWDRKWLYMTSHFVEAGAVRPGRYILQAGKNRPQRPEGATGANAQAPPPILASSVAKYVFKKGRRTVPPERILRASNLLPPPPTPRPQASASSPGAVARAVPSSSDNKDDDAPGLAAVPPPFAPESVHSLLDSSLVPAIPERESTGADHSGDGRWTWEDVERERERGMRVAGLVGELDEGLGGEFEGKFGVEGGVLARVNAGKRGRAGGVCGVCDGGLWAGDRS